MTNELTQLVDGIDFGEGPRWYNNELWYSDFYQRAIYSVALDGTRTTRFGGLDDRPSGLGWLPDGTLLVVYMTSRRIMRDGGDGTLVEHADLSALAPWHCNDMVVDAHGNAYVGNFGFDLEGLTKFSETTLVLVRPDGSAEVVDDGMRFPNGSVITPDGSTLIVGQTFGGNYVAFDIEADATLSNKREWAAIENSGPDGCTLDAEGGIWMADAIGTRVVRVTEGGTITDQIDTPQPCYACMLGGDDGRTLFLVTAPDSHPDNVAGRAEGVIYTTTVTHPHAGRP